MNTLWLKSALIRAVKTIAQTAVALIGTGAVGIFDVDWKLILSASILAGIVSILTSIAGLPEVDKQEIPHGYFEEMDGDVGLDDDGPYDDDEEGDSADDEEGDDPDDDSE